MIGEQWKRRRDRSTHDVGDCPEDAGCDEGEEVEVSHVGEEQEGDEEGHGGVGISEQ